MKTAIIGCGRIGFLLERDPLRYKPCTHYGGALSAGLRIDSACDVNEERLCLFAETAGIPDSQTFRHHTELLERIRPDMVIIATWTESHAQISIDSARSGARIIVLEKPMASNLPECRAIIRECAKRKTSVLINHERRYDNRYRKLKKILEDGRMGEIKTVHASILTGGYQGKSDPSEGGGPLLHDGTHLIDIIRYLFGEISTVEGEFQRMKRSRGFEDRAVAWIKTISGIDIFLEAGGNRDYFLFELAISGTEGKIVIGNGYEEIYTGRASRYYSGFRDIEKAAFPRYAKNNCFTELYGEAKKILKGKGSVTVSSTGTDGYRSLEVIHAIYLSSHLNRKPVTLPISAGSVDLKKIFKLS